MCVLCVCTLCALCRSDLWFSSHPNDGVMTDRPIENVEGRSEPRPSTEPAGDASQSVMEEEREQEAVGHMRPHGRKEGVEGFVATGRKKEGVREGESEQSDRESEAMFFFNVIRRLPKVTFALNPSHHIPSSFLSFFPSPLSLKSDILPNGTYTHFLLADNPFFSISLLCID